MAFCVKLKLPSAISVFVFESTLRAFFTAQPRQTLSGSSFARTFENSSYIYQKLAALFLGQRQVSFVTDQ